VRSATDLAHFIRRAATQFPRLTAVEDGRRSLSLAAVVDRAERFANWLDRRGVAPGAPVALLLENRAEFVELDFGLLLARRVRVALNARLHVDDFEYMLTNARAELLVHSGRFAGEAEELRERLGIETLDLDAGYEDALAAADPTAVRRQGTEEETAWISYTSGTTGRPKGVVLSRRALRHVGLNLLLELGDVVPGERLILSQPLSHGAGYFVLPYLMSGAGLFVQPQFDAEEIGALSRRDEVRTAKIVPAMLPDLLALAEPPRLDTLIYGGAPIGLPLLEASLDRFGAVLVQIYGQSEAPMTIACLHRQDHVGGGAERLSVGRPWRSVALRSVGPEGEPLGSGETGEIMVAGDHLMTGYLGLAEATGEVLRDGWLATRDMGYLDERGFVYLMGRRDEMIISGGFNIAPREVEQVLLEHDAVVECVVFGVDDDRWGAAVHAAIVCETPVSGTGLIDAVKPRLGFRTPKRVVLVDSIPKNAYGKLDRGKLLAKIDAAAGTS